MSGAVPILPSRDLNATLAFYERLGFGNQGAPPEQWDYLIVGRGAIELHFYLDPEVDPLSTAATCYLRVEDADRLHEEWAGVGVPDDPVTGSRLMPPGLTDYGMREFALVDPNGNLLRVGSPPDGGAWDWTRPVVDHLDLHASDFERSVRFYETVLEPLAIPKLYERDGEACFTHVNVVARTPPTTNLHLCFHARSRAEVDAFHGAGLAAGFESNGAPGLRDYGPGYYAAYVFDPDGNNVEALYRDAGNPGYRG
jgi:catechol 2,3-dioxygenase-like lactoylglutathione lyase family enzyme